MKVAPDLNGQRPSEVGRFEGVTAVTRKVMQANKGRDTKPEMVVRCLVHGMGYRYRLHRKDLPGRPDLAFGPRRKAVFVHGCFWHAHEGCKRASRPKTRQTFWQSKFGRNQARDMRNISALAAMGWSTLVIWECGLSDRIGLSSCLTAFLTDSNGEAGPRHWEFPARKVGHEKVHGRGDEDAPRHDQNG